MNEICCITNEGKTAKNEWENDDANFFKLYTVYIKKLGQFFSHTLLAIIHRSVGSYKYVKYKNMS